MGLSKEIKDFLGAAEAGQKIIGSQDDRAYKRAHAHYFNAMAKKALDPNGIDNRLKEARIKALGSRGVDRNANLRALREEDMRLRIKQRQNAMQPQADPNAIAPPAARSMDDSDASDALPADNQTAALDTGEAGDDTAPQQALAMGAEDQPEEVAATGGMIAPLPVQKFAVGGEVEDDDSDAVTPEEYATDPPDDADDENPPDDSPTDISAQSRKPAGPQYSPAAAHDAVREGLTYEADQHGLTSPSAVPTAKQAAGAKAYGKYQGAASPSQMDAVEKAIDPKGELPQSRRSMAALAYVYEYQLRKGNPEAAKKAAASMLGYYREVFDRYKHLSSVAAQHGDTDGALKAAVAAYDHVPDGYSIKADKDDDGNYNYSIVNEDTGQVKKGVAKPEELLAWATKGSSSSFQDLILKSAGARGEEQRQKDEAKANAPKGPLKMSDRKIADDSVDQAWETATNGADIPKPEAAAMKSSAFQIYTAQPTNISRDDAANAALQLTAIDKSDPTKTDFKAAPAKINGVAGANVKFKNGRSMFVPAETLTSLMQIRKQRIDAATKELESAKGSGERTKQNIDAAVGAVKYVGSSARGLPAPRRDASPGRVAVRGAVPVSAPATPGQALPVDEIQE